MGGDKEEVSRSGACRKRSTVDRECIELSGNMATMTSGRITEPLGRQRRAICRPVVEKKSISSLCGFQEERVCAPKVGCVWARVQGRNSRFLDDPVMPERIPGA